MIFFSDVLYTSDPPLYSIGHNKSLFPTECECVRCHGRRSDRMTDFGCHDKLHIIPSPLPPPLTRLCNILTIPLIGGKSLYFPPCTLLATIESVKKNIRLPQNRVKTTETFYAQLSYLSGVLHIHLCTISRIKITS